MCDSAWRATGDDSHRLRFKQRVVRSYRGHSKQSQLACSKPQGTRSHGRPRLQDPHQPQSEGFLRKLTVPRTEVDCPSWAPAGVVFSMVGYCGHVHVVRGDVELADDIACLHRFFVTGNDVFDKMCPHIRRKLATRNVPYGRKRTRGRSRA